MYLGICGVHRLLCLAVRPRAGARTRDGCVQELASDSALMQTVLKVMLARHKPEGGAGDEEGGGDAEPDGHRLTAAEAAGPAAAVADLLQVRERLSSHCADARQR